VCHISRCFEGFWYLRVKFKQPSWTNTVSHPTWHPIKQVISTVRTSGVAVFCLFIEDGSRLLQNTDSCLSCPKRLPAIFTVVALGSYSLQNTRHLFIAIAVKVSLVLGKQMPIDHCARDLTLVLVMAYIVSDICFHHKSHMDWPGIKQPAEVRGWQLQACDVLQPVVDCGCEPPAGGVCKMPYCWTMKCDCQYV